MRLNVVLRIWLMLDTMRVLASPGTPTSRQCPRVNTAASTCSMTSLWPTTTRRSWSSIWARSAANCERYSENLSEDTGGPCGYRRVDYSPCAHSTDQGG